MKAFRGLLAGTVLLLTMLTAPLSAQEPADPLTPPEVQAIAMEAAIYGLPIVQNAINLYAEAVDEGDDLFVAPLNRLQRSVRVHTPEDLDDRTPNLDVGRAVGWLDLRAGPIVLRLPEVAADRYQSVQLVDLYTYNIAYLGAPTTGAGPAHVMVAGPGWAGAAPEGVTQVVRCNTPFARAIYRTQLFDAEDAEAVQAIQNEYTVQPLSTFVGGVPPASAELPAVPSFDEDDLRGVHLLVALDELLHDCPVVPQEVGLRSRFARLRIGGAARFTEAGWSSEIRDALQAGIRDGLAAVDAAVSSASGSVGLHGDRAFFADDYLKRAVGAQLGLYGNSRTEIMQPLYVSDADGNALDARGNRYVLNLAGANLPPVEGFWSLTLYDRKHEGLVGNPINRYRIDSRGLQLMKRDAGGGVSLSIQHASPGLQSESNWLPAPDGPFYMVLRMYRPGPEAVNGTWKPPLLFAEAVAEKAAPPPSGAEPAQEVVPLSTSDAASPELERPTEWGEPTTVRVGIFVLDVDEVNSADQSFAASVYYEARWNSPFLRHKGPGPIHRNLTEVWTPRLTIMGQQSVWRSFPEAVEIQPDGEAIYRQKLWGRFSQPLDLLDFPQDTQTLRIHLLAAGLLEEHVTMVPLELAGGRHSGIGASFSVPDFDVVSWEAGPLPYFPVAGQQGTAGFKLDILVKRRFGFYVMKIIIPLCLIVIMSWLPRWISLSETSSSISISTTAFLTLVAYLFAITVLLPRVSYITRMDRFILLSMIMVFLCLVQTVMNAILLRRGRERVVLRIDTVSRFIYPVILAVVLLTSFDV